MMNSMAIGIAKPAGKLEGYQDDGTRKGRRKICVLVHPICRRSQEVDYLLMVESDKRGDGANQGEHDIIP